MDYNLAAIRFDEFDLDSAIVEAGVSTGISIEGRRLLAAQSLIALSMAMAITDEQQYRIALSELEDPPEDEEELNFFIRFGQSMVDELKVEFEDTSPNLAVFLRRADELLLSSSHA